MTESNKLRLLPWSGPDDKPCYLSADDTAGYLSRLADSAEETQLVWEPSVLQVLADATSDPKELRLLAADLTGALRDALRVATSRGHRLGRPAHSAHDDPPAHLS
ncbi:hypothetical protein ACFXKW_09770 [Streptomyces sp. NPDC059193]|uniref:hypothetical protein n=1 Tax=Streptomyces sp. NPDC059193 TaxID=3346763 RepID=UPI0036CBA3A0